MADMTWAAAAMKFSSRARRRCSYPCSAQAISGARPGVACIVTYRTAKLIDLMRQDHDLADHLARHKILKCPGRLRQCIACRDQGSNAALSQPLKKLSSVCGIVFRFTPDEIAPEHADHGASLAQHQIQRNLG